MSWIADYWSKIDSEKKARWVLDGKCGCLHEPYRHRNGHCQVETCGVECGTPTAELVDEARRYMEALNAPLPAGWMAL